MKKLRRFLAGSIIAAGLMLGLPATSAAATICPAPGLYLLYNENNELVGAMVVRSDCSTTIYWA